MKARWFKTILYRNQFEELKADLTADSNFDGAAALAYYLTLAIFPGLIFAFTLLPYLSLPDLNSIFSHEVFDYLPTRVSSTLQSTILQVMGEPNRSLMSVSFLVGLISASSGFAAIMRQMNIAYKVRETRSFLHVRAVAVLLTVLLTLVMAIALLLVVFGGLFISGEGFLNILRWLVTIVTVYSAISIVYYVAPDVQRITKAYHYFSPGSWLATVLILISTGLLSLYLRFFDSYNKVYGSLAGVIVLMIWFYLIGLALLMGAQLNHFRGKTCSPLPSE